MIIIRDLNHITEPFKDAAITIGNFDGVHIGHQALLHEVVETADRINGTAVAMTFEPHPMRVLNPEGYPALITLFEQKSELIAAAGGTGRMSLTAGLVALIWGEQINHSYLQLAGLN